LTFFVSEFSSLQSNIFYTFSSSSSPPFWIPIHILNPERPTECSVFNVRAGKYLFICYSKHSRILYPVHWYNPLVQLESQIHAVIELCLHVRIVFNQTSSLSCYIVDWTDSPRDFVQFIEWSPRSCPRSLLVANFHGRITIWTQPTKVCTSLV
jgi:hypothetical protein